MTLRQRAHRLVCALLFAGAVGPGRLAAGETSWQAEWERTVKAAEQEGEVAYAASGSYRFLDEFHKAFPKIKTAVVSVSCNDIVSRIMTAFSTTIPIWGRTI